MQPMKKVALVSDNPSAVEQVYGQGRRQYLEEIADLYPHILTAANLDGHLGHLRHVEAIFSTWGMPGLTPAQLDRLENLQIVFYAAGSVQGFAAPLLERGIQVVGAWHANAVPVAEYALAQILLANKGYFRNVRSCATFEGRKTAFKGRGNFGATVALLGLGAVGARLRQLLRPFQLEIVVFDPFLARARARQLGVEKVSLEEAFARGDAISNHLANNPRTRQLIERRHFAAMQDHAVFINTGRGATLVEADLAAELARRPSLTALLDVTDPEPPAPDSPLYSLPNALLTTHIAGSIDDEVVRMADYMLEEFSAWEKGEALRYEVSLEMLETMA